MPVAGPQPKRKASRSASHDRIILQARLWRWDLSWSFALTLPRDRRLSGEYYSEHTVLKLTGSIRYPEAFKYPNVVCYLHADRQLRDDKIIPCCIGSMQGSGATLSIYVSVFCECLNTLISVNNRLVALEINAEPFRYRKSRVMGINLSTEVESDW